MVHVLKTGSRSVIHQDPVQDQVQDAATVADVEKKTAPDTFARVKTEPKGPASSSVLPPSRSEPPPDFFAILAKGDLNPGSAYAGMRAAHLVFADDQTVTEELNRWGFDKVRILERPGGLRCYVAGGPSAGLVAFRGSWTTWERVSNTFAWTADAQALGLEGRVHTGWSKAFQGIRDELQEAIRDTGGRDKPLIIAGHSRGGTLAMLTGAALATHGFNVAAVCGYAAPNPGDDTLSRCITQRVHTHNVVFDGDMVPHVPPPKGSAQEVAQLVPAWMGLVRHGLTGVVKGLDYADQGPGKRYVLGGDESLNVESQPGADTARRWNMVAADVHGVGPLGIPAYGKQLEARHHPDNYLEHLRKAAQR